MLGSFASKYYLQCLSKGDQYPWETAQLQSEMVRSQMLESEKLILNPVLPISSNWVNSTLLFHICFSSIKYNITFLSVQGALDTFIYPTFLQHCFKAEIVVSILHGDLWLLYLNNNLSLHSRLPIPHYPSSLFSIAQLTIWYIIYVYCLHFSTRK